MRFTYKVAYNYSTVEFELDTDCLEDGWQDKVKYHCEILKKLAMDDDGKKGAAPKKKGPSDPQRRFLRAHGYKDADIDDMDASKAYKIINSIKEAEDEIF